MEKRNLVGRRYDDYLRNGIDLNLSQDEKILRIVFADLRYNTLLNRRKNVRRLSERTETAGLNIFSSQSSFMFTNLMRNIFDFGDH
jgi:hypothetical protein